MSKGDWVRTICEAGILLLTGVGSIVLLLAALDTRDTFVLVASLLMFCVMSLFAITFKSSAILRVLRAKKEVQK